jgi:chemotaxis regulatin CheY-phosphate phosphatase CheZ
MQGEHMGDTKRLPVIRLELNAGVFRIQTDEAVFEITVRTEGGLPQVIEKIVEREILVEKPPAAPPVPQPAPPPPSAPAPAADTFYKEISEDMYHEIGRLARQLSITIKTPIDDGDPRQVDLGQAGVDLEDAKGQLQDIVQMTEKATMDIMDVSEDIQEGCDIIKKNLAAIKSLHFIGGTEQHAGAAPAAADPAITQFFENLIAREIQVRDCLAQLPAQAPAPAVPDPPQETAVEKVKRYCFSLDVVFQTLYELCTNETVKKNHIRPMREEQETAFNGAAVMKAFSDLAPTVPVEETFYQFPLSGILKILFQHCSTDSYKQTLKKMHQSAATIFLDQTIPIEGTVEEVEVPVHKADAPETAGADPALLRVTRLVDENLRLLQSEVERLRDGGTQSAPGFSIIKSEDHAQLVSAVETTDAVLHRIIANIRRILESLSFQDLSGQRIKKILRMLSSVQVQLLSLLVSFGVKLKKKQESGDITALETEALATREVDRMKNLVAGQAPGGDDWGGPLKQDAVDKLLGELGF